MAKVSEAARELLRELAAGNGGLLTEESVLEAARTPNSPLHDHFTWDDGEAAERWRLEQARRLIMRVKVSIVQKDNKPVRVREFVSLPSDRVAVAGAGGYRQTVDVLGDDAMRAEMLKAAARELRAFRSKYQTLRELELGPVLKAVDEFLGD